MIVVRSETHRRHHSLELDGATIVPSWESPDRAEHVDRALDEDAAHEMIGPEAFDAQLANEVHDPDYVRFLAEAWHRNLSDIETESAYDLRGVNATPTLPRVG